MDLQDQAIRHVWIHFIPTSIYPKSEELESNPGPRASKQPLQPHYFSHIQEFCTFPIIVSGTKSTWSVSRGLEGNI